MSRPDDPDAPSLPQDPSPDVEAAVTLAKKLGVKLSDLASASGMTVPEVVGPEDDPDVPRLPFSPDEPAAVSSLDPSLTQPVLPRRPTRRHALEAALDGRPYDPALLPDTRAMLLAVVRLLIDSGLSREVAVQALLDAAEQ